ncbi:MAG: hypothetical protein Nkreftii_002155 [Candidatus Nitrospira kreftii]|uniref:Uncharacterized protein n=1 Tax=Candidatus Nitrospira kreftii TaxID=2652173 RepID=A0A7S8IZL6_9BACT|nr:MAG: hypothetical protein Nkreftii_002155 [Candidatus Nitrospira kreftii]
MRVSRSNEPEAFGELQEALKYLVRRKSSNHTMSSGRLVRRRMPKN